MKSPKTKNKRLTLGLTFILTGLLIMNAFAGFAASTEVFFRRHIEPVAIGHGVTHESIEMLMPDGWVVLNVVRMPADDVNFSVLTQGNINRRATIDQMIKQEDKSGEIIAAINTDFFDTQPLGTHVTGGQVITTTTDPERFASFYVPHEGVPYIGYHPSQRSFVTNGIRPLRISYFNRDDFQGNRVIYLNGYWNGYSFGRKEGHDVVEMVIVNHQIVDIRHNRSPIAIPENGYVISTIGEPAETVLKHYQVGQTLDVQYDDKILLHELVAGGGAQIVRNGAKVSNLTHNLNGRAQRTAVGISADGKEVMWVTVDGRTATHRGLTLDELADQMIRLGAHQAINMDGGGSTQMVTRDPFLGTHSYRNHLVGGARSVHTGLAIRQNPSLDTGVRAIEIISTNSVYYKGIPFTPRIRASNHNFSPLSVKQEDVDWRVEGINGEWIEGAFIPKEAGKGVLIATYAGQTHEQPFTVADDAVRLIVSPNVIALNSGASQTLSFTAVTASGSRVRIPADAVKLSRPSSSLTWDPAQSQVTAFPYTAETRIQFTWDGLEVNLPVVIGSGQQTLKSWEESAQAYTVTGHPQEVSGEFSVFPSGGVDGDQLGVLSFDLTQLEGTRAVYLNVLNGQIPSGTSEIKMWVDGTQAQGHWLRAWVTDAQGGVHLLTFERSINWKGWKEVTAVLPSDAPGPFVLERLYLAQIGNDISPKGQIAISGLSTLSPLRPSVQVPADVHREKAIGSYKIDSKAPKDQIDTFAFKMKSDWSEEALKQSRGFRRENGGRYWLLQMNNSKGSIRQNGSEQWRGFLNFVRNHDTHTGPYVLLMEEPETYSDPKERELIEEQLGILADKGHDVWLIYPTTQREGSYTQRDGLNILRVPYRRDDLKVDLKLFSDGRRIQFELQSNPIE